MKYTLSTLGHRSRVTVSSPLVTRHTLLTAMVAVLGACPGAAPPPPPPHAESAQASASATALTLAQQAQLDAQVAEAKAEAAKAGKSVTALQEASRALREEMARKTP